MSDKTAPLTAEGKLWSCRDKNTIRLVVRMRQEAVSNLPPWLSLLCAVKYKRRNDHGKGQSDNDRTF